MTAPRTTRWALASARAVIGTAVAVGFALAIGALVVVPLPGHRSSAVAVEALPTASDAVAVCAGPVLAAGQDLADLAALGSAAAQTLTAATADGAAPTPALLAGPVGEGPAAYTVAPEGRTPVELAAAGSAVVEAADLRGFAAAACRTPLFESWIVAGSAATGAADLVTLANPGSVAATVTVTVYGTGGATTAPGGTDVVVAPGTQVVLPLAGLRIGEATPVVQVVATGAPIAAGVQSSITRTLIPGGIEQTAAVAPPSDRAVIPGIVVPDGVVAGAEPSSVLRLLAPSADGTATVTLARADGGAAPDPQQVPLVAGQPVEVDLGALAPGVWAAEVAADAPVAAAVRQATGVAEGADFAWLEAAPALSGSTLAAVAGGASPLLAVANPADEPVTVTITNTAGATDLVVPARGTAAVPVAAGAVLTLDAASATVHAAVTYSASGALSGYPLQPGAAAASAIVVHP